MCFAGRRYAVLCGSAMGTNTYATPAALPGVPDIFVLHRGIAHANEVMAEGGNKRHRSHNRCMGTRKRMVAPATRFASVGCGLMASHLPSVARGILRQRATQIGREMLDWHTSAPPVPMRGNNSASRVVV